MKKVIAYQVSMILILALLWAQGPLGNVPEWLADYRLAINCILTAALAGVLYCVRAVYLNYCVHRHWDKRWEVWYYLRPLASAVTGLVAYIFLKASVIVLEGSQGANTGLYGYMVFSFIAGYNVDRFLKKMEEVAQSKFGVRPSRTSENNGDGD